MATRYVNPDSTPGGDGTTQLLTGATRAYASLNEWEAARQATLSAIEECICESAGSPDEVGVDLDGWTTTAAFYIDIKAGDDDRASTRWDYTKYRLKVGDTGSATNAIAVNEKHARFDGLQLECAQGARTPTWTQNIVQIANAVADCTGWQTYIRNCHLRNTGLPIASRLGMSNDGVLFNPGEIGAAATPLLYAYNNIVAWELSGEFFDTNTNASQALNPGHRDRTAYLYNNTLVGPWWRGHSSMNAGGAGLHYAHNELISGCQNAFGTGYSTTYCDYNSTDLSDIGYTPNGTNDREDQTFSFVEAFVHEGDDSFTVGSDTALESHTADSGHSWTASDRGFDVIAAVDRVDRSTSLGQDFAEFICDPASANYQVKAVVQFSASAATDRVAILARYGGEAITSQNGYAFMLVGDGAGGLDWFVYEYTDGTGTELDSGSLGGKAAFNDYFISLTVDGDRIIAEWDGQELYNGTDSTHTATGNPGIYMREDNWQMTALSCVNLPDYALSGATDGAYERGETDPGSGLFSDDIDGTTRSAPWDIGAHEWVSATSVIITDVSTDEAWADGDTGIPITGSGFV